MNEKEMVRNGILARMRKSKLRRRGLIVAFACAVLASVIVLSGCAAFGKGAKGARLANMKKSSHYEEGIFVNTEVMWVSQWRMMTRIFSGGAHQKPKEALPIERRAAVDFAQAPSSGLQVTWLGHSTLLIQIDGKTFLTDPVWGKRTSPYSWVGPKRWHAPPLALSDLPPLDAVILSHDHYDHLDYPTIKQMADWDTRFIAPLGVGAHLAHWGVAEEKITEVDWWDEVDFGGLIVAAVPARHASGRHLFDQNETLWAGYAFVGTEHRAYFSGDTGLFSALKDIGKRYGPFDISMIEVGAYGDAWPDWHMGPEQAVLAHRMVRGRALLPIHWGTFDLAFHNWTEPMERVLAYAHELGVSVATPRVGQSVQMQTVAETQRWWPQVPWQTAAEFPIVASRNGHREDLFDWNELRKIPPIPFPTTAIDEKKVGQAEVGEAK